MTLAHALVTRLLEGDPDNPKELLRRAARVPGLVQRSEGVSREDAVEANVHLRRFFREKGRERWAEQFEWTLKEVVRSWDGSVTYRFGYWHKGGEKAWSERFSGAGYEVRRFRTPKAALAGWRADLPDEDRYAYRGMSMQEWVEAQQQGFIKSLGKMNFGRGAYPSADAYTSFSTTWGTARSYASTFTNYFDNPTRRMPGVIVAVPREATQSAEEMRVGGEDTRVAERIPVDQVAGVWILTPLEATKGWFDLIRTTDGRLADGSRAAPSTFYAVVPKSGIALGG